MDLTLVSLATAVIVRVIALSIVFRKGEMSVDSSTVFVLAFFAAFMGFVMPATGFDLMGMAFRVIMFSVTVMIVTRRGFGESFMAVMVVALIVAMLVFALSLSPLSYFVAGLSPLSIP